jgi:hypothetical protein
MIAVIYALGTVFSLIFIKLILADSRISPSLKVVVFSISIIPMGKLIYFPIPFFYGLKLPFLFAVTTGLYWYFSKGLNRRSIVLFISTIIPFISLIYIQDPDHFFIYEYVEKAGIEQGLLTGTRDSAFLRLGVFWLLLIYCSAIYSALIHNWFNLFISARYFIYGTLAASFVGVIISILVWQGGIGVEELRLISVDAHITGHDDSFYRFNPGANVNEFSMILAFAMLLLAFARFSQRVNIC